MKNIYTFISLLSCALAFAACKDKTETTSPPAPASSGESQSEKPAAPEEPTAKPVEAGKSAVTPAMRAAKLGFAKHLPKNIAMYDTVINGRKAFDKMLKSPLGAYLVERMEAEGMSLEELQGNDVFAAQIASYSEEVFYAYGPGASQSFGLARNFLERLSYYGSRYSVFKLDGLLSGGTKAQRDDVKQILDGPLKGAEKDIIKLFAAFDMPAYYQGSKISDKEMRAQARADMEQMYEVFSMMGEAAEEISIKRGGAEFRGYKIVGEKLAAMLGESVVKSLEEMFDINDIEAFQKTLATKNLVIASGEVGDYVILFAGKSEDDFVLVDDVSQSICASDHIVFLDDYLDDDLLLVTLRDQKTMESIGAIQPVLYGIISSITQGLSDELSDSSFLGDTQDVEAILDSLSEQGGKLAAMFSATNQGLVCYLENGLKIESFGGSNMPSVDFDVTHSLAPMAAGEGKLLFANWASNPDYNEMVMDYVDALGEAGYLIAQRLSSVEGAGGPSKDLVFKQWKPGLQMFDQMFRDDILEIWKALRTDMAEGLGSESALIIDMKGSLPKLPNIPKDVLEKGHMPRIAYVSTVDDRSKLQESWQRINKSIESLLKKAGEMSGAEIPMQVPMSSEKNKLKTWFVPIPFQNDDFVPSISVSDELFFASTSKKFSEELTELAGKGGGVTRKGTWLHVDFKVLEQYGGENIKLYFENIDQFMPQENMREDIKANRAMIEKAMEEVYDTLDSLTIHIRNEDGRTRSSMHLKTK